MTRYYEGNGYGKTCSPHIALTLLWLAYIIFSSGNTETWKNRMIPGTHSYKVLQMRVSNYNKARTREFDIGARGSYYG